MADNWTWRFNRVTRDPVISSRLPLLWHVATRGRSERLPALRRRRDKLLVDGDIFDRLHLRRALDAEPDPLLLLEVDESFLGRLQRGEAPLDGRPEGRLPHRHRLLGEARLPPRPPRAERRRLRRHVVGDTRGAGRRDEGTQGVVRRRGGQAVGGQGRRHTLWTCSKIQDSSKQKWWYLKANYRMSPVILIECSRLRRFARSQHSASV